MGFLMAVLLVLPLLFFADKDIQGANTQSSSQLKNTGVFLVGEELIYEVSYLGIGIGKVRIKTTKVHNDEFGTSYSTIAYMDSYEGIPFVNLHQTYESKVHEDYYSLYFRGTVKEVEFPSTTEYFYDFNNEKVRVLRKSTTTPEVWIDTTLALRKGIQDGLSILFYARGWAGTGKKVDAPCFVNDKLVSAKVQFPTKVGETDIDVLDYDIAVTKVFGSTDFVSVFGLTGDFEGYFSSDEARIPIVAKLNVVIGSVKLELKQWKRSGWTPPKSTL